MKNLKIIMSCVFLISSLFTAPVMAMDFKFNKVTDNVYAFIGPMTDRTPENLGLNDNIGLVLTHKGAVLIDSGAGIPSAIALEKAAKKVTDLPIIAVINTGSQDHRWLGNGYFAGTGAKIYALEKTVTTQKLMADDEISHMTMISDDFASTKPVTSTAKLAGDSATLKIGGVVFELKYFGDAHFPGDAVVWLPKQSVLFAGDLIFVDRILGVHEFSKVASWQKAFHKAEVLPAKFIVPGHGQVCGWDKAKQDTGNYLDKLVKVMSAAADDMVGVQQAVDDNTDWPEFEHLIHYDTWHKKILNRTYLQFESER